MSKYLGKVLTLFVSQNTKSERTPKMAISVDTKGVIDDKFYDKNRERSVLLTSVESYTLALEHNIEIPYGALGENILIDYNPYDLPTGTQIKIGEAVVEVTQNCTICNHLATFDKRLPTLLKDDRGIFVKVIKKGIIKKGDKLYEI